MAKKTNTAGLGSVYRRKTRHGKLTTVWWLSYSIRGKQHQESARTTIYADAVDALRRKLGKLADGQLVERDRRRLTVQAILADVVAQYETKGRASVQTLRGFVRRWNDAVGDLRALDLSTARISDLIRDWRAEGLSNGTINRHLAALRKAFRLADLPIDPARLKLSSLFLEEAEPRDTYLPVEAFYKIHSELPDWLRDFTEVAFLTSIRRKQLALTKWAFVDPETWVVTWPRAETKSRKTHRLALAGRPLAIVKARYRDRSGEYVFPNADGRKLRAELIHSHWTLACKAAGVVSGRAGFTFHDLRRAGISHLTRSGTNATTGMSISGHSTRRIFDDYNVGLAPQQRQALIRASAHVQAQRAKAKGKVIPLRRRSG